MTDVVRAMQAMRRIHLHLEVHLFVTAVNGMIYLDQITVEHRGEGQDSLALERLCKIADRYGVTVVARCEPNHGVSYSTRPRLRAWYKRHGFVEKRTDSGFDKIGDIMRLSKAV